MTSIMFVSLSLRCSALYLASCLCPSRGHVTAVALEGSDGGLARYRLVMEPWLAFLGHRQDSWVFLDKTVVQIIDEVLADYQGQGRLAPAWRWDLADASVYPQRSLCTQYQETDLAFVQRLLREEGLFGWFEHSVAADDDSLGRHCFVIADHNGAFSPNAQATVRYTQAGASFSEDSLVRWQRMARVQAARLALASPDYRGGPQDTTLRPASTPMPTARRVSAWRGARWKRWTRCPGTGNRRTASPADPPGGTRCATA